MHKRGTGGRAASWVALEGYQGGLGGEVASTLSEARGLVVVDITERAAVVSGLETEQPRYYLQHALGFQVHDVRHPQRDRRHGRADIGWRGEKHND